MIRKLTLLAAATLAPFFFESSLTATEYYILGKAEPIGVHLIMHVPTCNCTLNGAVQVAKVGDYHAYAIESSKDLKHWELIKIVSVRDYEYFMLNFFSDEPMLFVRAYKIM